MGRKNQTRAYNRDGNEGPLKDAFVSIAGPLSFILEVLAAVLTPIGTMISVFTKLMSLFTGGGEKLSFWEKTLGVTLMIIRTEKHLPVGVFLTYF